MLGLRHVLAHDVLAVLVLDHQRHRAQGRRHVADPAEHQQHVGIVDRALAAAVSEQAGQANGVAYQEMLSISTRTPVSWSNPALTSVVSRIRFVAAAVAAMIMS